MRDMIKPTVSMFIICLVVSTCLALVNNVTRDVISLRAESDAEEQRRLVLSKADAFKLLEGREAEDESGLIRRVYAAYDGGKLIGYVFNASPKGFGGEIAVTVGISIENRITGVRVGNNSETPGLGSKTADLSFSGQYRDRDIRQDFVVVKRPAAADNEVQAVSGATISSAAVTKAVQASARLGRELLKEQDGGGGK